MNQTNQSYRDFYYKLTSNNDEAFFPYQYQERVNELLIKGHNIILSVPTGAGKTWASIMPFLYAKNRMDINFPKKMIYSLPLRALCNSISEDTKKAIEKTEFEGLSAIQTGEFSEDKYFESDIVFSTIDQTLSNFLCFPLPLSQRQANINAGALIGSYLVFDEFHLLDGERSMATTLGMLRMLGKLSRFCIMTATLSDDFMTKIKGALDNVEIVTLDGFKDDVAKIGSLQVPEGKASKKEIEVASGIIKADKIKEFHDDKTIVICNRVETAQRVYLELEAWAKENIVNLICLHSRFFDRHRKATEKKIKKLFGKDVKDKKTNSILISTQVIEAGMDISCEVMHTEIAPINALLQRVGRCARYKGEYGRVFVYDVLEEEEKAKIDIENFKNLSKEDKTEIRKLNNLYLPYDKALCKVTFEKLKFPENQQLSEAVTIRLVNEILVEEELKNFDKISRTFNQDKIKLSWSECSKSHYRNLVRDIQSIDVVVIDEDKKEEIIKNPFAYDSISIFRWSMVKWIKEVFESNEDSLQDFESEQWFVGQIEEDSIIDFNTEAKQYSFTKIHNIEVVKETYETLYINRKYFFYHEKIGLNKIEQDQKPIPKKIWKDKEKEVYEYKKDTFEQHNKALLGHFYKNFLPKMTFTFKALNDYLGTTLEFEQLIKLMIVFHDYGKLNEKWQNPMRHYQALKEGIELNDYQDIIAHTQYSKGIVDDFLAKGYQKGTVEYIKNLPDDLKFANKAKINNRAKSHADIGALLVLSEFGKYFKSNAQSILSPIATAIMRHHKADSKNYYKYSIPDDYYNGFLKLWNELDLPYQLKNGKLMFKNEIEGDLSRYLVNFSNTESALVYFIFARILRICDQEATKNCFENLKNYEKYVSK